jgi:Cu/Ag efflux pump CusA
MLTISLAAGIGWFPAAISPGSRIQQPLTSVVVGGMLVGPVLLLGWCRPSKWCSWDKTMTFLMNRRACRRQPCSTDEGGV